jgi:hypothetical protein
MAARMTKEIKSTPKPRPMPALAAVLRAEEEESFDGEEDEATAVGEGNVEAVAVLKSGVAPGTPDDDVVLVWKELEPPDPMD